jgi:hypothetical protein
MIALQVIQGVEKGSLNRLSVPRIFHKWTTFFPLGPLGGSSFLFRADGALRKLEICEPLVACGMRAQPASRPTT